MSTAAAVPRLLHPWADAPLVLASGSARRRDMLAAIGVPFVVDRPDIDESLLPDEAPATAVRRLAERKAAAVAARHPRAIVLAADTLVVHDGQRLGKPASMTAAAAMIRRLSGCMHQVLTGVCLKRLRPAMTESWHVTTDVAFHRLSEPDITAYLACAAPLDKAGAYAIQAHGRRLRPPYLDA